MTDNTPQVEKDIEQAEVAVEAAEEAAKESEEKAEVAEKIAEAAEEKVEEAKEEVKEEKVAPTGKFADLIKEIEGLTALELAELVKALEDRFGVSAAAPVAVAAGAPAAGAAAEEEKANYTVVLTNGGTNKIGAIKAVREVLPDLGLVEAKEYVENPPKNLKENVPTEEAKAIKEKLEAAGASVELK